MQKEMIDGAYEAKNVGELGSLAKRARQCGLWSATHCWLAALTAYCEGPFFELNKREFLEKSPMPVKGKHGSL